MFTVFHVIVADSSFLVSLFRESDSNNPAAVALSKMHLEEEMLVPDTVLFETLTALNYREGFAFAKEAYGKIVGSRQNRLFSFSEVEREGILEEFFLSGGKLSVADASVVYLARKTGSEALAFDAAIKKALAKK